MIRSNVLVVLGVAVGLVLSTLWFVRRSGLDSAMGGPAGPQPMTEEQIARELAAGVNESRVNEILAEARRVELGAEQLEGFEAVLRDVRADPRQTRTWLLVKRYEKTLPLFTATEQALMACLKGLSSDPKACLPTAEFRKLLDESVAAGDLPREEADQYLDQLALLRDPKTRPAMPKGTAGFMEKESAMKVRNMERIAAAVRRVDAVALLSPKAKSD
ncbi:MAG: hypothetical protein WC728_11315 [Elusimicrobiota bacterium]